MGDRPERIIFLLILLVILGHTRAEHGESIELIADQRINIERIAEGIVLRDSPQEQFLRKLLGCCVPQDKSVIEKRSILKVA